MKCFCYPKSEFTACKADRLDRLCCKTLSRYAEPSDPLKTCPVQIANSNSEEYAQVCLNTNKPIKFTARITLC